LSAATAQTILSQLAAEGAIDAILEVRCPSCTVGHGTYERRSEVPDESKTCFNCGTKFSLSAESNWGVIYEISSDPEEFFPEDGIDLSIFTESGKHLSPNELRVLFEDVEDTDNNSRRGQRFDYFMGIIFHQLEGSQVVVSNQGTKGEVDVHVILVDAPDRLYRLMGPQTLLENKWEQGTIETSDVSVYQSKLNEVPACRRGYFISINGFSTGRGDGALSQIKQADDPPIHPFTRSDVERMVEDGGPEDLLMESLI
jgi:hypothetical protein